jgi:radical SAM protein with 4Fe4S-binding SPASM domain
MRGRPHAKELDIGEVRRFFASIRPLRPSMQITGGEPLVRPDIREILQAAGENEIDVSLVTNGTLLDEEWCCTLRGNAAVRAVIVSLDGPEAVNDVIRGHGAYGNVMAAIRRLCAHRVGEVAATCKVVVAAVITGEVVPLLKQFLLQILEHDVAVRLQHLMWYSESMKAANRTRVWEELGLSMSFADGLPSSVSAMHVEELKDFLRWLRSLEPSLRNRIRAVPDLTEEHVQRWYLAETIPPAGICAYAPNTVRVEPDGSLVSCPFIPHVYGNVREGDVVAAYRSDRAAHFRTLVTKKVFPACMRCCKLQEYQGPI